jgi:hypothetical protein
MSELECPYYEHEQDRQDNESENKIECEECGKDFFYILDLDHFICYTTEDYMSERW